jgi:hypothetical protein
MTRQFIVRPLAELLHTFPYAAYFRVSDEVVVVLAVLHLRRNPKTWRARVRT